MKTKRASFLISGLFGPYFAIEVKIEDSPGKIRPRQIEISVPTVHGRTRL